MISKFIPINLLFPFVNFLRFFKILVTTNTLNIRDLEKLHDIKISQNRMDFNQKRLFEKNVIKELGDNVTQRTRFKLEEFSIYSQHGEDGLITFILKNVGIKNYFFVELGAGGKTSNTELLALSFGWRGAILDGSKKQIEEILRRYSENGVDIKNFNVVDSWITKDNIDDLISKNCVQKEVDVLSIDLDGNDYWIWKSIKSINARLVVIEYNASLGAEKSIVINYQPDFNRWNHHPLGWYHGASLKALENLAKDKGYTLVCCDSSGVNAFFVRNDLICDPINYSPSKEAFYVDSFRSSIQSPSQQFNQLMNYDFTDV